MSMNRSFLTFALLAALTNLAVADEDLVSIKGQNLSFGVKLSGIGNAKTDCKFVTEEIAAISQKGIFEIEFGKCTRITLPIKDRVSVKFNLNVAKLREQNEKPSFEIRHYAITETDRKSDREQVYNRCNKVAETLRRLRKDDKDSANEEITFVPSCIKEGSEFILDTQAVINKLRH